MLWTGSQRGLRGRVLRIALRPWARRSTVLCLVLASRYPPTSTPPAAFLRASVTPVGANPTRLRQFEGSGDYYAMGSVGAPSTGEYFIVYSVGAGESFGNTMLFSWYDAGPLTVGDYPIHEPQGGPEETRKGLEAVLSTHRHGVESYASTTGTLTITSVSDSAFEGRFSFRASRYCFRRPDIPGGDGSCIPSPIDLLAPQVDIEGTFVLVKRSAPGSRAGGP